MPKKNHSAFSLVLAAIPLVIILYAMWYGR